MDLHAEISAVLQQARAEIQANMQAKGINASGRTSRGFIVEDYAGGIRLVLSHEERTAPLATLEIGRAAGGVPRGFEGICKTGKYAGRPDVSKAFKYILIKWAEDKGLSDFGWGAATSLGRKIAYEGTARHHSPVEVYSEPVKKAQATLRKDIRTAIAGAVFKAAKTNF